MKVEIKNKNENVLLNRTEVSGEIIFQGATPKKEQLRLELAKTMGVKPELVISKKILAEYGGTKAAFEASVYKTEDALKKIEPKKGRKQVEKIEEKKEEKKPEEKK